MAAAATGRVGVGREVAAVPEARVAAEDQLRAVAKGAVAVVGWEAVREVEARAAVTMVVENAVVAARGARGAGQGAAMVAARWRGLHVEPAVRAQAPNTAARLRSGRSQARPGGRSGDDRARVVAMRRLLSALLCLADGGRTVRRSVIERW